MIQDNTAERIPDARLRDMANAIRALTMDAVERAKSGHPGMPLGMADVATALFTRHLRYDPADPQWPDRDRFVLSAGHGSMLIYSLLFLAGYPDIGLDELAKFRQLGSRTAGHPEYGHAAGIETTTGPLGQGIATAVGMALGEAIHNARFGEALVDHHTYVIAGDGCLMEGISQEAISIAGHLRLRKLIVLWDDNRISIDGPTDLAVSDDIALRFKASGWDTQAVDGHDVEAVSAALDRAKASDRPSLIACRTVIGYGSPGKAGTAATHGSPLGLDEVKATRAALGWPHEEFVVPPDVLDAWRAAARARAQAARDWRARLAAAPEALRARLVETLKAEPPAALASEIAVYKDRLLTERPNVATRKSSEMALEIVNRLVGETIGGSADLTGSNNTLTRGLKVVKAGDYDGRYVHWGVREHGMAAAMNGLALHGGFIPYGGTFLAFADYSRPAIRLAALMGIRVVHVMTHDSIGLGEDGPTHQPVEHLAALRAIPNLLVLRPADAVEALETWEIALHQTKRPSLLVLSRQNLPLLRTPDQGAANLVARGGYELVPAEGKADVTLIGTGSELQLAVEAREILAQDGIRARVVSLPCFELFAEQDPAYRAQVLGEVPRIAVEAGIVQGWEGLLGAQGQFIGMTGFGASGPEKALYAHFGITAEAVAAAARRALGNRI